jgi:hypothetical protein
MAFGVSLSYLSASEGFYEPQFRVALGLPEVSCSRGVLRIAQDTRREGHSRLPQLWNRTRVTQKEGGRTAFRWGTLGSRDLLAGHRQ